MAHDQARAEMFWETYTQGGQEALGHRQFVDAEGLFSCALKEAESFQEGDPRLLNSLQGLVQALNQQNKHAEAETVLRRILELREQLRCSDSPAVSEPV